MDPRAGPYVCTSRRESCGAGAFLAVQVSFYILISFAIAYGTNPEGPNIPRSTLLLAVLMPALQRVRKQARAVTCQASLHQWTLIWSMFTTDNDGFFNEGAGGESETGSGRWPSD